MTHDGSAGRLFLAALPDADTAARIYRLASVLKRAHNFEAELIEPQRLHISLFFLGSLPIHTARIACEAAAELRVPPFDVCSIAPLAFEAGPAIVHSSSLVTMGWTD